MCAASPRNVPSDDTLNTTSQSVETGVSQVQGPGRGQGLPQLLPLSGGRKPGCTECVSMPPSFSPEPQDAPGLPRRLPPSKPTLRERRCPWKMPPTTPTLPTFHFHSPGHHGVLVASSPNHVADWEPPSSSREAGTVCHQPGKRSKCQLGKAVSAAGVLLLPHGKAVKS